MFRSRPSDDVLDALAGEMFARWSAGLVRAGMPAPLLDYGLDVQRLDPTTAPERLAEQSRAWASYIAKGLAQEAALGAAKEARGINRSIRQLMRAALIAQRIESPGMGVIVEAVDMTARAKLVSTRPRSLVVSSSPGRQAVMIFALRRSWRRSAATRNSSTRSWRGRTWP